MHIRMVSSALAGIILLGVTACSTSPVAAPQIDSVETVSITADQTPTSQRVIALANGSAEIIASLGHLSIVKGRDISSTTKVLSDVEIVTSGHQVIPEKVLQLKPDLVLIDDATGPTSALKVLSDSGIRMVTIPQAWSTSDISRKVMAVAQAVGTPTDGSKLTSALLQSQKTVKKIPSQTKIVFLYLRGANAIYLIGGAGSGADSLISAIGGVDVGAQKLQQPFTAMSAEAIATLNPDLILVMSKGLESVGGVEGLIALPGVAQTNAGKNKRVVAVDDSLLLSFGPRTYSLITTLADTVNAELSR